MAVIARDAVASDQLVYAWPFPIGPEPIEVSCGTEEIVVMCPAWTIGDRLGPGRHQWRSPDPTKPSNAYFVLSGPVEVPFDMITTFVIPTTQQPVRVRAQGSLLARCMDPGVLVAQFVGLPFDNINNGLMRSVGASVERLLARVLVRRVIGTGAPAAVTDPAMLPSIVDELTAYNPAAGAVTGVGFVRFNQLVIQADDGGMGMPGSGWNAHNGWQPPDPNYSTGAFSQASVSQPYPTGAFSGETPYPAPAPTAPAQFATGSNPPGTPIPQMSSPPEQVAGVISGEIGSGRKSTAPPQTVTPEGSLLATGSRVLVPSADGSLHAAVIRQHSQGYYEVEIGATGQTVWVPIASVIPESR
jgi:hypothetical protein